MKSQLLASVFLLVAIVSLYPQGMAAKSKEIETLLKEGRDAHAGGNAQEALLRFERAAAIARETRDGKAEAEASLNEARVITSDPGIEMPEQQRLEKVQALYRRVAEVGTPEQQALAQNDLALVLLNQGKAEQAVEGLRRIDPSSVKPNQRFIFDFNLARALAAKADFQEAYDKYKSALGEEPRFQPAAEAAFGLLRAGKVHESSADNIRATVELSTILLRKGQAAVVGPQLHAALSRWRSEPSAVAVTLLGGMLRFYTATALNPTQFEQTEWPLLQDLRSSPNLGQAVDEIRTAYLADFPVSFRRESARDIFPTWARSQWEEDFSAFMTKVGNCYDKQKEPEKALARYAIAWACGDPGAKNIDAASYAAVLLRDHPEAPQSGELLDQLIESIFWEKGLAYTGGRWEQILRFHALLGNIFEKQEKWGPPDNPRSAWFQWEHAIEAEKHVRREIRNFPATPGLHFGLANAYRHGHENGRAWDEYITSAQGFVDNADRKQAKVALEQANSLRVELTPGRAARLKKVNEAIKNVPDVAIQ